MTEVTTLTMTDELRKTIYRNMCKVELVSISLTLAFIHMVHITQIYVSLTPYHTQQ